MHLTISLDESHAGHLRRQAATRQLPPEQLARDLLREALGKLADEEQRGALERRRLELIRRSRATPLTSAEQEELRRLQDAVDQRLEPFDTQLLAQARQFQALAEQLPDATNP